jgi:hypothetical protein
VGEPLSSRTDVNVLLRHVAKVLLAEALWVRGHRLWQRDHDACFVALQDFFAAEVAAVSDNIEIGSFKCCLRLLGYMCKLRPVAPDVGHLMRDDQMVFGVDGNLDVVADDT